MARCHYTYVEGVGRVFIPGCWQGVMTDDMSCCTCYQHVSDLATDNATIRQLKQQIKKLEDENQELAELTNKQSFLLQKYKKKLK